MWLIQGEIRNIKIVNKTFQGVSFKGKFFSQCLFENVRFINCDFTECNFENTKDKDTKKEIEAPTMMKGTTFSDCNFSKCYFGTKKDDKEDKKNDKETFGKVATSLVLESSQFSNCNFKDANVKGLEMLRSKFMSCGLQNVAGFIDKDLSTNHFEDCSFMETHLKLLGMVMEGSFVNCFLPNFSGHFSSVAIKGCKVTASYGAPKSQFTSVNFTGTKFDGLFSGSSFRRSNLTKADFTGVDLTDTQFHDTNIDGANFEDADLGNAVGFDKIKKADQITWKTPKPLVKKPLPSIKIGSITVLVKILKGSAFAAIGQLEDSDDEEDDNDDDDDDEEEKGGDDGEIDDGLGDNFEAKIEAMMDKPEQIQSMLGDILGGDVDAIKAVAEEAKGTTAGAKIYAIGEEVSMATKMKMIEGINRRTDHLQSSTGDKEKFAKFKRKLDKALNSKRAKMVNNSITALTGISAQMGANYLSSLVLAGNTPAPKMKRQLGELTYLLERMSKTTEPVLLATLTDSLEDWKSLWELQNDVKGEKARAILTTIFSDPGVILALGLAEQLSTARVPPPGFLKVVKEGLSGHMKKFFFKYRNAIVKEETAIERVMAKQQQIIALGVSFFTSVLIGFFSFIASVLSGLILG